MLSFGILRYHGQLMINCYLDCTGAKKLLLKSCFLKVIFTTMEVGQFVDNPAWVELPLISLKNFLPTLVPFLGPSFG